MNLRLSSNRLMKEIMRLNVLRHSTSSNSNSLIHPSSKISLHSRPHNLGVRSRNFVRSKPGVQYNIHLGTATMLSPNVNLVAISIMRMFYFCHKINFQYKLAIFVFASVHQFKHQAQFRGHFVRLIPLPHLTLANNQRLP